MVVVFGLYLALGPHFGHPCFRACLNIDIYGIICLLFSDSIMVTKPYQQLKIPFYETFKDLMPLKDAVFCSGFSNAQLIDTVAPALYLT